jgi:hypothetical protein
MMTRGLLLLGFCTACFQPRATDDADALAPPVELFEPDAGDPPVECDPIDPSPLSALHIEVRTSAFGGRFAPKNVGAIWIEDTAGAYVKTVELWGQTRAKWLVRFQAAASGNVVDAVTGATLLSHGTHEVTWNLTDLDGCEVANQTYQLLLELTDRSGEGASHVVPFDKGVAPADLAPADSSTFHDMRLRLE